MGWFDWIVPKETVTGDDKALEDALIANRIATQESVRLEREGREKSQTLLALSESALRTLDSHGKKK